MSERKTKSKRKKRREHAGMQSPAAPSAAMPAAAPLDVDATTVENESDTVGGAPSSSDAPERSNWTDFSTASPLERAAAAFETQLRSWAREDEGVFALCLLYVCFMFDCYLFVFVCV